MSEVLGQFAAVRAAFDQPTLTLLNRPSAAVTVTLLRTCFSSETPMVETARLHQLIDNLVIDLRNAGAAGVPDATGRELCQRWVKGDWLGRIHDADGREVYTMTSHAQTALKLVEGLDRDRPTLSEHRIATIIDAVRRFNANANPSRTARVRILQAQIADLVAERDRLEAGGQLLQVDADYMLQGFAELLDLVDRLPADFKRVTEAFDRIRRDILERFRSQENASGEVVDSYLQYADELTTATLEGRAFEGAFALLRDDALLMQLREDLEALLDHPHADTILTETDRRQLRSTVQVVRRGLDEVLDQRSRATKAIKEYVTTHDVARDRLLDSTLRALDAAFGPWLAATGPRTRVPVALLPESLDVTYLPRSFYDPQGATPPAPLADPIEDDTASLSLVDMVGWGGPALQTLASVLADAEGTTTAGEVFAGLEPELRRPVDILGLLHLLDSTTDMHSEDDADEQYAAVRPDGSTRVFTTVRTPVRPTRQATTS